MITGIFILDVILVAFVCIAGFMFTLWALITGIFWLTAILPSGRRLLIWRTVDYGDGQELSGARERANYARERRRILTRHGRVDPGIYYPPGDGGPP